MSSNEIATGSLSSSSFLTMIKKFLTSGDSVPEIRYSSGSFSD